MEVTHQNMSLLLDIQHEVDVISKENKSEKSTKTSIKPF